MRGVFATRSPDRPNPIGLHPVRILAVDGLSVTVHPMEALDGTPVLDIKPLIATEGKDSPPWGPDIPAEVGEALRFVGREAWERGLVSGKNGNLSQSRNGKRMVITCHGSAPGRLGPGDLVSVDFASLPEGAPESASSESRMHAAIYRAQPLAGAVLHTHPPSLLALSLLHSGRRMLQLPLYEAATVAEEMILVPGSEPGDPELAENVARAARDKRAVFLQGHGLVCWGEDLEQALDLTEELVSLARIQLLSGG
jgi:L-fuculose-phosphate aldolase